MSSRRQAWFTAFWLLIHVASFSLLTHAVSHSSEGDFAFDTNDDIQAEITHQKCDVKRLWGVPDMTAYAGRVFKLQIPAEAFSGKISHYKTNGKHGPLPKWLIMDKRKGLLRGVPSAKDLGEHTLIITAVPFANPNVKCPIATDVFTIEVILKNNQLTTSSDVRDKKEIPSLGSDVTEQCHSRDEEMHLTVIIDRPIDQISQKQKIAAINNLANFMALDYRAFLVQSHSSLRENFKHDAVFMSGIADKKKKSNKATTEIQLTVGCSGKLWPKHSILVHQLKAQAKDGTISNLIHLPVISWEVLSHKQSPLTRKQRAVDGEFEASADGPESEYDEEEEDYSGSIDMDEDYYEAESTPPHAQPVPKPMSTTPETIHHHHRHHHGENILTDTDDSNIPILQPNTPTTEPDFYTFVSTTTETHPPTMAEPTHDTSPIPESTSIVNIPESTKPTEITTLDDTSQMETETSTFLYLPRHTLDTSRPTATAPSPTVEVSTFESTTTLLVSPATQPNEDTATTFNATTINANVVQSEDVSKSYSPDESSSTENVIIEPSGTPTPTVEPKISPKGANLDFNYEIPIPVDYNTSALPEEFANINNTELLKNITSGVFEATPKEDLPTEVPTSTERSSTIFGKTTETIEFTLPANSPPQIQHRTKKVPVTAGKALSYIIPKDLFIDSEDGTNLQLAMYDIEHTPLKSSSWVQFNPENREVYGLPLEEHVSKWEYIVEATDSRGASVNDTLDITVQQHKSRRAFNHEFSMKLRVAKKYPAIVDWQIRVLKGLVSLFKNTDMDKITVRSINLTEDPIEFTWTNDTLPTQECPKADIDRIMAILESNSDGDPSAALVSAMSPEIIVKSVTWKGTGSCQGPPSTPITPELPDKTDNFSPMVRNRIKSLRAIAGELFIFKVPSDTFYDHEDVKSGQPLKLWLTKLDKTSIHPNHWLQFDTKNQEFYGLPMERDVGEKGYQLICEDSGGMTASDSLMVNVRTRASINPTIEFKMTIDTPYDGFAQSALVKRKFVENLHTLFDDRDYSSIRIKSITKSEHKHTVISWYNASLPTDRCPEEEIGQLKKVLIDNKSLTDRVHNVMGADLPVVSVSFVPIGACSIGLMAPPLEPTIIPPILNEDASKTTANDDYIITFIVPIVVIVCMIFIASFIACILYRRRHSGKMTVGDEEERQAFRSKGIPVIFQDELDEKPDPSNKTPIIMKEEKPPLLPPPEYKGADSSSPTPSHTPYLPPPPFTASRDNARNNRPKPTPTYRKPPPYVPP